jgi:hypothetical protein
MSKCDSKGMPNIKSSCISFLVFVAALTTGLSAARAQTSLSEYVDARGFIDVQRLTCAQMANASQQDINMLSAWYSGWYNGLAHKRFMDYRRTKEVEQEALAYCRVLNVLPWIGILRSDFAVQCE